MAMTALRKGASGGFLKYILMGLLVMAVGGLVMMDIGGFFRGGITSTSVVDISGEEIPISEFDRTVRRSIARYGMTQQNAYQLGLIDQILSSEIRSRIVHNVALKHGLLVDEKKAAEEIKQLLQPMAAQQNISVSDALNQILYNQGITEREFVESLQREVAGQYLVSAVQNGFHGTSDAIAETLYNVENEARSISYIAFLDKDAPTGEAPNDADLEQLYQASKEQYAKPELRTFQVLSLNSDDLRKTLDISQDEIQTYYDDNIDAFTTPETRTMEQALFTKEDDAKASIQEFNAGKSLKEAVQVVTGSQTAYLGELDLNTDSLIDEIKDAVMEAKSQGEIIGPIQTPLGWSVVLVKDFKPETVQTFEEVQDEIRQDIEEEQLIDEIYDLADMVDDLFASGATPDEIMDQVQLNKTDLPPLSQIGQTKDGSNAFKDHAELKILVLENGFDLVPGEASPVQETEGGKLAVVYLDDITEKTYTPFETVKGEIEKRWLNDQKRLNSRKTAFEALQTAKASDVKTLAQQEQKTVRTLKNIVRGEDLKKPLTAKAVQNIFQANIDEPVLLEIDGGFAVAVMTGYQWPDKPTATALAEIKAKQVQTMKSEALSLYLQHKQQDYDVYVNQALLERMYGQETAF